MIPVDFLAEFQAASAALDSAKLKLLAMEVEGLPWQVEAQELLAGTRISAKPVDRVILFTGHRIDEPGRESPRFPMSAEGAASRAIKEVIIRQTDLKPAKILGVSGGANGGDILFQEACRDAAVPRAMPLALPPQQFIPASVEMESGNWVARFQALMRDADVPVLAQQKTLPPWLSQKPGYDLWQRNNLWLIAYALAQQPAHTLLVALWDGQEGDGPGGTGNMVSIAKAHGAEFVWLDSRKFIHSAAR